MKLIEYLWCHSEILMELVLIGKETSHQVMIFPVHPPLSPKIMDPHIMAALPFASPLVRIQYHNILIRITRVYQVRHACRLVHVART